MKKFEILGLILLVMIAFIAVPGAQAQRIGVPSPLVDQSLTAINVASTNTVDVSQCATLSVQAAVFDQSGSATATNTVTVSSQVSLDGVGWLTGPTLTVTAIGSNAVSTCISNYAMLPYRYWRTIALDNSTSPTNAWFKLVTSRKPGL